MSTASPVFASSRRWSAPMIVIVVAAFCLAAALPTFAGRIGALRVETPLDPTTLTKYVDALTDPGIMQPTVPGGTTYNVGMYPIYQQLHSQLPATLLFGYGQSAATASYPGRSFVVTRGTPINVNWTNNLTNAAGVPDHPPPDGGPDAGLGQHRLHAPLDPALRGARAGGSPSSRQ